MEYAIVDDGVFVEYRHFDEAPVLPGKPYRQFLPVLRETGEAFEGIEGGNWIVRTAPAAPQVPETVTARQARLALLDAGKLHLVQAAVDDGGDEMQIAWEYATEIGRHDPLVLALAPALDLDDSALDALFIAAAQI